MLLSDRVCRDELPFLQVRHLRNSLNMDRPVHVGRDGQVSDADGLTSQLRLACFRSQFMHG